MVKTVSPIFRKLFQTVKDPVLILNTSCQIESINNCAAQLLNINIKETEQLTLDEQSKIQWFSFVKKIKTNMGGFCNLRVKVNQNQYKEIKLIGYYHEKKNLIFARIGLINEMTNNSDLGKSPIYHMVNEIPHGLIFMNLDGKIVEMNDLAAKYIQCEKSLLINERYENIFEQLIDYEFSKLKYFEELLNSGRATLNVSTINNYGEENFFKLESKFNYNMSLIVTTITDETEKIMLKLQLEQQNSLNSIGEMAASIAHEIRNPMTSLKGFIELLKLNSSDNSEKYLNVMDSELHRMEEILTDLLYLSKPKQRSFEMISINQVVEEVIELMLPHANKQNIILKMECYEHYSAKILGNDNRLKQMLINLIKNGIEVMACGGTMTLGIEYKDSGLQLTIRDEGKGLSNEELNNLFTPFYTTKESGTGLGLVLVKKVVEEHNGTITVESCVGFGTTFIINLPYGEQQLCPEYDNNINDYWYRDESTKRLPVV